MNFLLIYCNLALNDLSIHENLFLINIAKWNRIDNNKLNDDINQVKLSEVKLSLQIKLDAQDERNELKQCSFKFKIFFVLKDV
jgi:hypothetical protein